MSGRSKFDFEEEENKVRKNLSRLIHTLQHFPSKRSRLDTSSLWNLVDELESFNPENKNKSMHFTQTTERKTYSKKCLDLHITHEKENPSFAPCSCKTKQTFANSNSGDKFSGNKFKKSSEKVTQKPKVSNSYLYEQNKGKNNRFSNNSGINKSGGNFRNERLINNNFDRRNVSKHNYLPRRNQLQSKNNTLKNEVNASSLKDLAKNLGNSYSLSNKRSKDNNSCKKSSMKNTTESSNYGKRSNILKRNQNSNFKCKSHQCTPKSNEALQNLFRENNKSSIDRCSVVKKLTNYWNNLLNNEFEHCNSSTESSGGSCQNFVSLGDLTQGTSIKSETQSEKSSSTLKSRHLSESNINIMKRVEDLDAKNSTDSAKNPREKASKIRKPDSEPVVSSVKISNENSEYYYETLKDKGLVELIGNNIKDMNKSTILGTEEVIQELQMIINTLKSFPNCNILSDQIIFPQNLVKKMLFIMVESLVLKPQSDALFNKLEYHADEMVQEIIHTKQQMIQNNEIVPYQILSSFNKNLEIEKDYISKDNEGMSGETLSQIQEKSLEIKIKEDATNNYETFNSENSLVLSRINLNTIRYALNMFKMWEEIIWLNRIHNYNDTRNYEHPLLHSYTIVFEEEIIIEEESSDEDNTSQVDTEEEGCEYEEEGCENNSNLYKSAAANIQNYIERVIDVLENFWPDSPELLVRMIYQALVSILVWWVIVKEIFVK